MDSDFLHYSKVLEITGLSSAELLGKAADGEFHAFVDLTGWPICVAEVNEFGKYVLTGELRMSDGDMLCPIAGYLRLMAADPSPHPRGKFHDLEGRLYWVQTVDEKKPEIGTKHLWFDAKEIEAFIKPPPPRRPVLHWYEEGGVLHEGLAGDVTKSKKRTTEKAFDMIRNIFRAGGYHNRSQHLLDVEYQIDSGALEQIDSPNEYTEPGAIINFVGDGVPDDPRMTPRDRRAYLENMRKINAEITRLEETDENPALLQNKRDLLERIQQEVNKRQRLGGKILNEFGDQDKDATAAVHRRFNRKIEKLRDRGQHRVADYLEITVIVGPEGFYDPTRWSADPGGWEVILDPPGD